MLIKWPLAIVGNRIRRGQVAAVGSWLDQHPYPASGGTKAGHLFRRSIAPLFTVEPIARQTTHFVRRLLIVRPAVSHAFNQHKFQP